MRLYEEKSACCGCGACVDACHADAVCMVKDREGFFYPHVNGRLCDGCGRCASVCPVKKSMPDTECRHQYFGAQAKNDELRYSGSSGGIFPVIAGYVLRENGIVYGAGYDGDMRVIHKEAGDLAQLEELKKTKYVQSDMTGIYRSVEERLKEGRPVLFCGTACQTHALKLYLGRSYEKLILMDLICYGVPSPGIWQDYVAYLEREHGGKMTEFYFRDKRNKDSGHTCSYVIGGKEYAGSLYQDIYCMMYFKNYILRPACHSCKFCIAERDSDITIGDFWGIEKVKPEADDGMGTSVVILHTERGKAVWDQIKEEVNWFECRKEDVLQPRLTGSTAAAENRRKFMVLYRVLPFSGLVKLKKVKLKRWWK